MDWLAVWDAADEQERRAVLRLIYNKVAAWQKAETVNKLADVEREPVIDVVDARREYDRLIVITSASLRLHYLPAPFSGHEWHAQLVAIDETTVAGGSWAGDRRLYATEIVVGDDELDSHDDAAGIAEAIAGWRATGR
jgi:hypothetical protein